MKKTVKRILLIASALLILLIGIGLVYYFPMLTMPSVETGQIPDTNVYTVNAMSAVFLVETTNGYAMIDAGLSPKKLQESLKEIFVDPDDVKWIFLTHSDGDHLAALPLFPNANIYMSEDELPLINGTLKRSILGGNSMPSGVNVDRITSLSNGQELLLNGTKVECISAPGHTYGSMLYLVDDLYLFTGDAFKIKNGNIGIHPYTMDKNLSKKTIEQLRETINGSSIVLTSHYGYFCK